MINLFKTYLKKIISKAIKEEQKDHWNDYNPYNINFFENSRIGTPLKIDNGQHIWIHKNSYIGKYGWLAYYGDLKINDGIHIEENVSIGNYSCITAIKSIIIGSGTLISEYFYTSDHSHGFDPLHEFEPVKQPLFSKGKVVIGKRCYIGYRVTIMPGVEIGNNCVIGAHSVVTRSFPGNTMIAGTPAKIIKRFSEENKCWIDVEE